MHILATIKKQVYLTLNDRALIRSCYEPVILLIRGKNYEIKSHVYSQLNSGQKAMMMFEVLYGHAHTPELFYQYVNYYIAEFKAWPEIKKGIRFFDDPIMLEIYEEVEALLVEKNRQHDGGWRTYSEKDLDNDSELCDRICQLFERYKTAAQDTIKKISSYIRENSDQFVQLKD